MHRRGFTLVEAVVALAVVSILAGLTTPLAIRILNQRRAAATRESLKVAFEAMFGSRDRRVANMRADFGFNPTRSSSRLDFLVTPPKDVPPFRQDGKATFAWGYNGPYWQGPVLGGHPVDAWGNPIDLICKDGPGGVTWQVHSPGPDRSVGDDDLYYPPTPAPESGYRATLLLVVTRASADISGTVTLRHGASGPRLAEAAFPIDKDKAIQNFTFTVPAGVVELVFNPKAATGFKPFAIPMDLLPGHTREKEIVL